MYTNQGPVELNSTCPSLPASTVTMLVFIFAVYILLINTCPVSFHLYEGRSGRFIFSIKNLHQAWFAAQIQLWPPNLM